MIRRIEASNIILSAFTLEDAPLVEKYAGDADVARTTQHIPHPYPAGGGVQWISNHLSEFEEKKNVAFTI